MSALPQTPGAAPATPRLKRASESEEDGPERKKLDVSDSPRKSQEKREAEAKDPGTEKKQRIEEEEEVIEEASASMPTSTPGTRLREEDGERLRPESPSKVARLYPPHYAGIQSVEAHGDEEVGQDLIPEEVNEEMFAGYGGNEDEEPPITTEAHLQMLDEQAKKNEVERMLRMPAMEKWQNAMDTPFPQNSSSRGNTGWSKEAGSDGHVWWQDNSRAASTLTRPSPLRPSWSCPRCLYI